MIYTIEVDTDHIDAEVFVADAARDIASELANPGGDRYSVKLKVTAPHLVATQTVGWWTDDPETD